MTIRAYKDNKGVVTVVDDALPSAAWKARRTIISLASLTGNLDSIDDGTTYVKPKATALTSGEIDLSKSGVINKTATYITETATKKWAAETGADITGSHQAATIASQGALATKSAVDLATAEVLNRVLDNIADTASYKKLTAAKDTKVDGIETGADVTGSHQSATVAALTGLDADALAESATKKWAAESNATVGAKCGTNLKKSDNTVLADDDVITSLFKTAASPNPRIEISTTLIVGYSDATTKQFYLNATDGKAYFAAGNAVLDDTGLTFLGTAYMLKWKDALKTAYIWYDGTDNKLGITTHQAAGSIILGGQLDCNLLPLTNDTRSLGAADYRWNDALIKAITCQTLQANVCIDAAACDPLTADTGHVGTPSYYWADIVSKVLTIKQTTTPTAEAGFGKIYTKAADDKLYFQNAQGVEKEIAFV